MEEVTQSAMTGRTMLKKFTKSKVTFDEDDEEISQISERSDRIKLLQK
jgi:hypothetical protein